MASGTDRAAGALEPWERERLAAIRAAGSLSALAAVVGGETAHDAYFRAKPEWRELRGRELAAGPPADPGALPGNRVEIDGHAFHVHGITHADTEAEREFLREHAARFLDRGATVYCEQGIRRMYLADTAACAMDDYRWALKRCRERDLADHLATVESPLEALAEDLASVAGRLREGAFSLIESGSDVYGEAFARALGDVASEFLLSHEDLGVGRHFEAFSLVRGVLGGPARLADLQRYYERTFLPQPLEREWLRRHDPELELLTHGRNERMADYAVSHNDEATEVHIVVGAAHQPGVTYYLERHRDGERDLSEFELV